MQTRSEFLTNSALAALATPALAPSPHATVAPKTSSEASMPPLQFDLTAFDAQLETAAPHRHMFASIRIAGGQVLSTMHGVITAYGSIGTPVTSVQTVAVLYHAGAVTLAFKDRTWNRYFIPMYAHLKPHDHLGEDIASVYQPGKTKGNPCLDASSSGEETSIEELATGGARFYVCNLATKGFARLIADKLKKDAVTVYRDLAADLVPNATLVPAGIWALHAIQERGYTYEQVNL